MSHLPAIWTVVLSHLALALASPIYAPQFLSGGTGRNIRHLPCVSLNTGETGVCMFAFTCAKSNGTHLGTCIDRFYFGSCCKLADDPEVHPQDNTIEDASAASSFVTAGGLHESNEIPNYFTRPKPITEKKPETSTSSTISQTVLTTKQPTPVTTTKTSTKTTTTMTTTTTTPRPTTTTTQKIITKRPTFFSTPYTTTQPPISLSTLQTLHTHSHGSGSSATSNRPSIPTSRPTGSKKNSTTVQITKGTTTTGGSPRPGVTVSSVTKRPSESPTITKRPGSPSATKPLVPGKPITPLTTRPVTTTTEKPSTRFPPRNATTPRPLHTGTNTRKPIQSSTKKPASTTKRPSTATRRPVTASKPSNVSTRPVSTTNKTSSTGVKAPQTTRPPPLTSTQQPPTTFATVPLTSSTASTIDSRPSHRPITKRPPTTSNPEKIATTQKPPTPRPETTFSRPRPSSKPTRPTVASTGKPTTPKTTPRPQQQTSTDKVKPSASDSSSTLSSSTVTRPSTSKPTFATSVRPKPTEKPSKPSKPSKPPVQSTATSSSTNFTTTAASTPLATSSVLNETTIANEILSPKPSASLVTTTTTDRTTQPLGLVTWSSNSDDDVTKAPQITSPSPQTTQEPITGPEWSPITTPDGWIMIQSPTTEKTTIDSENATKFETSKIPTTAAKPSSEGATTESVSTMRPTVPTTLSTIATVTAATDLPVPMETLNMSDYTQVCGRRLFPESRIVGGDHTSFGRWPWQISLRQWRTAAYLHKCGAALLNENWAITAAHCVENVPPSDLLLRIGEHDLANENEPYGFQERRVQIVASHPQFDPRTFEYDLALLRFYEPVLPFQPNLLPICLPDDDENYVGHTAYVTGWGRLYEDGPLPSVLQEVSVPVVNNTVCEGMYRNAGYIEHIPHIFICAGWRKGGFDSCEGDSGGPMVIQRPRDKRWILAGVISWGIGCAEPNQPGVYTRISEFREWINQILQF